MNKLIALLLVVFLAGCASTSPAENTNTQQPASAVASTPPTEAVNQPSPVVMAEPDSQKETTADSTAPALKEPTTGPDTKGTTSPTKEIAIQAYNFGWEPTEIKVNKGDNVKLVLTSRDGVHGFGIVGYEITVKPLVPGEAPKTAEFVADKAGTFEYYCSVPCGEGHRNMRGKLIVT